MGSNFHASAVVVGERGVVISGASGSGKSGLALALIDHASGYGLFARLVGDDQLLLSGHQGRLVCEVPATIAGLVEIRGLGPHAIDFEHSAVVDLHVRLVGTDQAPRYPDRDSERLASCAVRTLTLCAGDRQAAVLAVAACLDIAPFGRAFKRI